MLAFLLLGMMKKSKHIQRWYLQQPWLKPMIIFNLAAIKIQTLFRGCGCRTLGPKRWNDLLERITKNSSNTTKKGNRKSKSQVDKYLNYMDVSKSSGRPAPKWLSEGFTVWCAVSIYMLIILSYYVTGIVDIFYRFESKIGGE